MKQSSEVDPQNKGLLSMRVAEQLTGLASATIRAWERRYGAVTPQRTSGNTRKFTRADIRRLLLLRQVTQRGHSIGDVANLANENLEGLLRDQLGGSSPSTPDTLSVVPDPPSKNVTPDIISMALWHPFMTAVSRFDVATANDSLQRAAAILSRHEFVSSLVWPFLQELKHQRDKGSLDGPHERLATQLLKAALYPLVVPRLLRNGERSVLVSTTPRHPQPLRALAIAGLVTSFGHPTLYMGANVPDAQLLWTVDHSNARRVVLDARIDPGQDELERVAKTLNRISESVEVWLIAAERHGLRTSVPKARFHLNFRALDAALEQEIAALKSKRGRR